MNQFWRDLGAALIVTAIAGGAIVLAAYKRVAVAARRMNIGVLAVNQTTGGRAFQVFVPREGETGDGLLRRAGSWVRLMTGMHPDLGCRLFLLEQEGREAVFEVHARYGVTVFG